MPNTPDGLRFDVYERVHLSEDVAGIEELDEIELMPRIQVITQGEQIILRGNLLLTGSYSTGDQERSQQTLEHWIPVEITLPLHRVHRLEDISVEIDNFDVDLLSTRTLNITGVLSLRGLQIEQAGAYPASWEEEQITVVHRTWQSAEASLQSLQPSESEAELTQEPELQALRPPSEEPDSLQAGREPWAGPEMWADSPSSEAEERLTGVGGERQSQPLLSYGSPARQPDRRLEAPLQRDEPAGSAEQGSEAGQPTGSEDPAAFGVSEESLLLACQDAADERERQALYEAPGAAPPSTAPLPAQAAFGEQAAPEEVLPQAAAPFSAGAESGSGIADELLSVSEAPPLGESSKTEMKIAFSGKESGNSSFGISSLLQSNRREQEAKALAKQQEEQQQQQEEAEKRLDPAEEVQWKKLFLSKQGEEREFRKVRICIVQREETLETIAGRYQLNPREIVLYNRLPDPSVTEGQMLYIP